MRDDVDVEEIIVNFRRNVVRIVIHLHLYNRIITHREIQITLKYSTPLLPCTGKFHFDEPVGRLSLRHGTITRSTLR